MKALHALFSASDRSGDSMETDTDITMDDAGMVDTFQPAGDVVVDNATPDRPGDSGEKQVVELYEKAIRGTCRVVGCGPAKDKRSYYCENHVTLAPSYETKLTQARLNSELTPQQLDRKEALSKAKQYTKFILNHNDDIVKAKQLAIGAPEEWMDGVVGEITLQQPDGSIKTVSFWEPCLRKQLAVSEEWAKFLGKSIVRIERSDTGKKVMMLAKVVAPFVEIGGILLFSGLQVYQLTALRKTVEQVKQIQLQQMQAMMQAQTQAQNGRSTGVAGEPFAPNGEAPSYDPPATAAYAG